MRRDRLKYTANMNLVVTLATPLKDGSADPSADATPHGVLAIMSPTGAPTGFLNAEELTAFRTALSSSLLFTRRQTFKSLVVFGAGRQAYWHIRLALMLRGKPLKTVYIINRSFSDRVPELLNMFLGMDQETKEREGWANVKFSILTPGYRDYQRMIREYLREADCVITTVPSTTPLFDHSILTSTEGRKKGRLFIAIGSYKPHMIELPVELVQQAVRPSGDHRHFHKHAEEGGVVIVDTLTGCLNEAGEIIQAGLTPNQLVEVGELVMLEGELSAEHTPLEQEHLEDDEDLDIEKIRAGLQQEGESGQHTPRSEADVETDSITDINSTSSDTMSLSTSSMSGVFGGGKHTPSISKSSRTSFSASIGERIRSMSIDSSKTGRSAYSHKKHSSGGGTPKPLRRSKSNEDRNDVMTRWLGKGNVIYKSVGMGLMDLVVGREVLYLARARDIGVSIPDF